MLSNMLRGCLRSSPRDFAALRNSFGVSCAKQSMNFVVNEQFIDYALFARNSPRIIPVITRRAIARRPF